MHLSFGKEDNVEQSPLNGLIGSEGNILMKIVSVLLSSFAMLYAQYMYSVQRYGTVESCYKELLYKEVHVPDQRNFAGLNSLYLIVIYQ